MALKNGHLEHITKEAMIRAWSIELEHSCGEMKVPLPGNSWVIIFMGKVPINGLMRDTGDWKDNKMDAKEFQLERWKPW